jgi:hypothetical protein
LPYPFNKLFVVVVVVVVNVRQRSCWVCGNSAQAWDLFEHQSEGTTSVPSGLVLNNSTVPNSFGAPVSSAYFTVSGARVLVPGTQSECCLKDSDANAILILHTTALPIELSSQHIQYMLATSQKFPVKPAFSNYLEVAISEFGSAICC